MEGFFDDFGKLTLVHSLFEGLHYIRDKFNGKGAVEQKVKIADAITSIKVAIVESRKFIQNVGYETNAELVKLWQEAFNKTVAANIDDQRLLDALYYKADFWGTPKDWLDNPHTLELIPKLKNLNEECQALLIKIKSI